MKQKKTLAVLIVGYTGAASTVRSCSSASESESYDSVWSDFIAVLLVFSIGFLFLFVAIYIYRVSGGVLNGFQLKRLFTFQSWKIESNSEISFAFIDFNDKFEAVHFVICVPFIANERIHSQSDWSEKRYISIDMGFDIILLKINFTRVVGVVRPNDKSSCKIESSSNMSDNRFFPISFNKINKSKCRECEWLAVACTQQLALEFMRTQQTSLIICVLDA